MAQAIRDSEFMDDTMSSGVDGDLVKYAVEYGPTGRVNPNVNESSTLAKDMMGADFYDADGPKPDLGGDDFYDATGEGDQQYEDDFTPDDTDSEDYSNLTLINKKKRARMKKGLKKFGKNIEKLGKAGLAALAAKGAAGATAETPPEMPIEPEKTGWAGMSTAAKAAIIIGGVAVIGGIGYLIMKKNK
jgi:hypothetical protein